MSWTLTLMWSCTSSCFATTFWDWQLVAHVARLARGECTSFLALVTSRVAFTTWLVLVIVTSLFHSSWRCWLAIARQIWAPLITTVIIHLFRWSVRYGTWSSQWIEVLLLQSFFFRSRCTGATCLHSSHVCFWLFVCDYVVTCESTFLSAKIIFAIATKVQLACENQCFALLYL